MAMLGTLDNMRLDIIGRHIMAVAFGRLVTSQDAPIGIMRRRCTVKHTGRCTTPFIVRSLDRMLMVVGVGVVVRTIGRRDGGDGRAVAR